ncbi:hypothetical protein KM043_004085 [Ampulex compressa]|nr:hypothetical protein KM043_004085 [Ampulex compressa]
MQVLPKSITKDLHVSCIFHSQLIDIKIYRDCTQLSRACAIGKIHNGHQSQSCSRGKTQNPWLRTVTDVGRTEKLRAVFRSMKLAPVRQPLWHYTCRKYHSIVDESVG